MGAYGHSLSVTKHAFFVLCMYGGHPNIIQTYRGVQTYGGIQTYRGCPNIQVASKHRGHQNILGVSTHGGIQTYRGPSKHVGTVQMYGAYGHLLVCQSMLSLCCVFTGGIQTSSNHIGHPNIWGASKHTYGSVHTYSGGIQT